MRTHNQIVFSTVEWTDFMMTILEMQDSFFKIKYFDEESRSPVSSGDFLYVTQLIYEAVNQLMVDGELEVDLSVNTELFISCQTYSIFR